MISLVCAFFELKVRRYMVKPVHDLNSSELNRTRDREKDLTTAISDKSLRSVLFETYEKSREINQSKLRKLSCSVMDRFNEIKRLGSGAFGTAKLVERKSDKKLFVVKDQPENDEAKKEAETLKSLMDVNIVR